MLGGALWEQTRPAPPTSATESGYSLPTPVKYDSDGGRGAEDNYRGLGWNARYVWSEDPGAERVPHPGLKEKAEKRERRRLPTPVAYDAAATSPGNHYRGLGWQAKHGGGEFVSAGETRPPQYPTPIRSDATVSKNPNVLRMVRDGEAFDQLARVVRRQEMEEAGADPFVEHAPGRATSAPQERRARRQWPTPTCTQPLMPQATLEARMSDGVHDGHTSVPLVEALQRDEHRRRVPTPVANDARKVGPNFDLDQPLNGLAAHARKEMHPTPTSLNGLRSSSGSDHRPGKWQSPGHPEYGELSPEWVEWLMNWPIGWTSLEPLHPYAFEAWERGQAGEPGQARWWLEDPSDDPGSGIGKTVPKPADREAERARQSRIAALGNGQVSACAAAAFVALWEQPDPDGA